MIVKLKNQQQQNFNIWAASWENLFMLYVNNKDADQPLLFAA